MDSSITQVSGSQGAGAVRVVTSPPERAEAKQAETQPDVSKPLPMLSIDPARLSKQIQEAVAKLNEQMKTMQRDLGFSYDERLHREIVTVRKQSTGEVVRQLPPEVVLRVAHSIEDLKGLLYDDIF
jgi:flagellar protein FlaG